jgi:nitrogen regulatory protein PII
MKKIEAVITPERLDAIREQLACLGIYELTLAEIKQSEGNYEEFPQCSPGPLQKRIKLELIMA